MSKGWKIGLWIGIPVVLVLLLLFVLTFVFQSRNMAGSSVESYGMVATDEMGFGVTLGSAGMERKSEAMAEPNMATTPQATAEDSSGGQERLIIKTGSLSMVVEDVRTAIANISQYAEEKGGFVVSSNVNKSGLILYGGVTVRIPADIFDESVEDVKAMGEVESQRTNGQDVTEEYVDLDAQLKNLRATENQFLAIMKQATEIEDILAVQRELSWVRGEIDRIEGRMKYLRQSAELSTLTVYLSTDPDVLPVVDESEQWKPLAVIKQAARSLLVALKGFVNLLIWFVIFIPLWLLIAIVVWIIVKLIKHRRNKSHSSPSNMLN